MQAFSQSAFLQALAHSLIASIWQMALLWLMLVVLLKLFNFSSAQKFNLAFITQLSGFGWFLYTCFYTYNNADIKKFITTENILINSSRLIDALMPYLAILYIVVLLFKLGRLVLINNDTQKLRKQEFEKISADNRVFVQRMTELFSIHRKVKIYLSKKISCPLTTGFLKPIILIPLAAVNSLTQQQMEAVILHELAHIKRADYLLFILQSLVEKILFFNIFSIMLSDIIERERENACDDWVLQFKYNAMHYAEALFKLGRLKALPALAMPLAGKKENLLLIRIKRVLHNSQSKNIYSLSAVLTGLLSLMIAAFLLTTFSGKAGNKQTVTADVANASLKNENTGTTVAYKTPAVKPPVNKSLQRKILKNKIAKTVNQEIKEYTQNIINTSIDNHLASELKLNRQYLTKVKLSLDSLKQTLPQYRQALNNEFVVTPEVLQKAVSYQNFKQIENMLAVTGDSINVTETQVSKNSYKKNITIESFDKNGNKHVYNVVIELYQ